MPLLALTIFAVYVVIAFGIRAAIQARRTADSGFRGFSGTPAAPSGGPARSSSLP